LYFSSTEDQSKNFLQNLSSKKIVSIVTEEGDISESAEAFSFSELITAVQDKEENNRLGLKQIAHGQLFMLRLSALVE